MSTVVIRLINEKTMSGEVTNITPVALTIISDENEYTIPWTSILYTKKTLKKEVEEK